MTNDASNEQAIRSVQQNWKSVRNSNIVSVYLAFTNSGFGDSSLFFVTDYHPLSETLAQKHFSSDHRFSHSNRSKGLIPEQILWGYIVQIANALKAVHTARLAARCVDPDKIIITGQNRIRLNACAILDVVRYRENLSIAELQRQDLLQFGQTILAIATNNLVASDSQNAALGLLSRSYSTHFNKEIIWLLEHSFAKNVEGIDAFLVRISANIVGFFDSSLHLDDQLHTDLNRELENSRIVRLLTKLNFINERPEYDHDLQWNEQGNRYILKLFRDYVFHQVDSTGRPVLDLAHVLSCLNKLDVGTDEKIMLVGRDELSVFVISYKELKATVEGAFGELRARMAPPG